MATTQNIISATVTQDAIVEDQATITQIIHGDLVAQQEVYRSQTGLECSPLYSSNPDDLQRYATWLDGRPLRAEVLAGIKQFLVERDDNRRYVATLLLGAQHKAVQHVGLKIEFGKTPDDIGITWSCLDLREPTSDALELGSFGC